jgi:hypothetical protein
MTKNNRATTRRASSGIGHSSLRQRHERMVVLFAADGQPCGHRRCLGGVHPTRHETEGLSSTREPPFDAAPQPVYQHSGLSGACGSSLAGVPTCAGECRLVRVTGVLASWDERTCVALVLASWDRLSSTREHRQRKRRRRLRLTTGSLNTRHPWPTRLPEPGKRASHTVTSGIVGSDPDRTDRRLGARQSSGASAVRAIHISHSSAQPGPARKMRWTDWRW